MRKELFPAQVSEIQEKNIRSVLDTGKPYYAEDITTFFDKRMWLSTWLVPLRDQAGNVNAVMGISRDISGQKATEARLRESEEMFREMAENINETFYIFTPDWKQAVYISPGYEQIWGRSLKSIFSDPLSWLDAVHPEDRERPLAVVKGYQSGKLTCPFSVEFRIISSDGTVKWILGRTYPVRNEKGQVYRIAGIAEDITERKKAEIAVAEEKALSDLYLDLMCHDINNMNQIGIGFLELAMDEPGLDEKCRSLLSRSMGAMEGSTRLIDNLRKLKRVKSGELHRQVIDLGQVLTDVKKNYSHIPGRTVTINYVLVKGYRVVANELLYDLFSNLVDNAIKQCYYCASNFNECKGTLLIDSGVEKENVEKARNEILKQLDDIKNGIFTDENISDSVLSITDGLRAVGDTPDSLCTWYFTKIRKNQVTSPDEDAEIYRAVTRERIIAAAKSFELDTVYLVEAMQQ
jgi:PAS domain S-box-containing protein